MTDAGWYPDPSGSPQQRYWNGTVWTEHTQASAQPAWSAAGNIYTTPLPEVPVRSAAVPRNSNWYARKAFVIPASIVGVLVLLGAIGAAFGSPKKASDSQQIAAVTSASSSASSAAPLSKVTVTVTHSAAPTATAVRPPSSSVAAVPPPSDSSSGDDGSFVMPNEVGKVLQDAQDDIQRVSGDPIFFSHSHDLLGDRFQILDQDWKVCDQNLAAGATASAIQHIDFGVVKLSESCP